MIGVSAIYPLLAKGKRQKLEDYIYPSLNKFSLDDRIFIVCDGVGGENKGEVASQIVAETVGNALNKISCALKEEHIQQAILTARDNLKNFTTLHPEAEKMSTTFTIAFIGEHGVLLAWCGDSKIYHISGNQIVWKSKDHSLVQQLLDKGEITADEVQTHPNKNIILRSISVRTEVEQISFQHLSDLEKDDYILLATDGLFEQVNDSNLIEILNHHDPDKSSLLYQLCEGKTSDNYAMYLLRIGLTGSLKS